MSSLRAALPCALLAFAAACPSSRGGHPSTPPAPGGPLATSHRLDGATAAEPTAIVATAPAASPLERYLAGDRTFGVFPIADAARCDAPSWSATAAALGMGDSVLLPPGTVLVGTTVTVGAMTGGIVDDLGAILVALRDAGGSDIDGHHVCVVPAAGVGVALSTGNGFIAFEPAAILQMNDLIPDAERTMYSASVAFAHELAHQIQYWYGNPFADDKSVRRTELAADCMGSAFVAMTRPSGWIMDEVERGAVGALQAYADLKFRSKAHHGTRYDRARMAHDGIGVVAASRRDAATLDLATIKNACEAAVLAWDASQTLTPPDQLWGGTED